MESLIEGLERNRPSSLGFCSSAAGSSSLENAVPSRGGQVSLREWCAQAHGHKHFENLVGHGRDERLDGSGEKLRKSKGLAGVATHGCGLRRVEIGKHRLVESQVGPAGEKAEDGEPCRRTG